MADVHPALLMYLGYRHTENRVMAELAEAGFDDVTLAQARVFQRLAEDGIRLTDLAEQAQLTKQSTQFLVDQLEQAGYVERRPDPSDARARLICIAERGREAQLQARQVENAIRREWTRHLGKERMALLTELLQDLRPLVDPFE
ncbi:MAG: MarR family transcriptional regulator [Nocardioidaceae bacterium]|nr:MarR family transcriptional regulator [Nocardioidaceae bacterium]